MISWRGIVLIIIGIALYGLLKERTMPVAIAFELIPVLLVAVDWFVTPDKSMFSVRREGPARYVVGVVNQIQLIVENRSSVPVAIQIRDDTPQTWVDRRPRLSEKILAGESVGLTYDAVPPRRGVHEFGHIHLRVWGRLGLIIRQYKFDARDTVKVLPDIRQIKEEQLLARTARLRHSDRVRRILPGRGTEFSRVREYNIDDEYRHLNWKATAKWGRPMVNEFEVTRAQTVLIAVDAGRLSGAELAGMTRLDHAINAAIRLAYVSVEAGDRVGLVVFADRVLRTVPPDGGARVLRRVVQALSDVEPRLVDADFSEAFGQIMQLEPSHSLLCVFTDVVESWTSEELCAVVKKTSRDHLITCLTMTDPEIMRAAHESPKDAQSFFQKSVALEIMRSRELALKKIQRSGAVVVDTMPGHLVPETINTYLMLKSKAAI